MFLLQGERKGALEALLGAASRTGNERVIVTRGDSIERLFECMRELEPGLIVVGKHAGAGPDLSTGPAAWRVTARCGLLA